MPISPAQISVVIQGPVVTAEGLTRGCLQSLRAVLPGATLILSTWEGAVTEGLDFDELVASPDPGPGIAALDGGTMPTNVNRQIVSTQAGLRLAQRPFTLKFRTDLHLAHPGFLEFFERFPARAESWRLFGERVLILDHFSRNPRRSRARKHHSTQQHPDRVHLFHPSDMIGFGRTEDVQRWWDVPLSTGNPPTITLAPEQYLWLAALRPLGEIALRDWRHDDPEMRRLSELTIANNFVILRREQFGVRMPRHPINLAEWGTLYTHADWRRLYRELCGGHAGGGLEFATVVKGLCYPPANPSGGWAVLRRLLAANQALSTRL